METRKRLARPGPRSAVSTACTALDFLAALCTLIPDAGRQIIRYYGQFSQVRRDRAHPARSVALQRTPCAEPQDESERRIRRSWAPLLKRVYEADPLIRPRCSGRLKIVSLIDAPVVIERILRHLKLRDRPERAPPTPRPRTHHYESDWVAGKDTCPWLHPAE